MTETAITAGMAKTVKAVVVASLSFILKDKEVLEDEVPSRTAQTNKTVMKAPPVELNPLFRILIAPSPTAGKM